MSIEDRLEILELIAQYSYAYDAKDADAWSALFTEDAVFEAVPSGSTTPVARLVSVAERRQFAATRFTGPLAGIQSRHYQTGTVFDELTPNSARTRTMLLITHQPAGEPKPSLDWTGVYEDTFRKTPDGWRFSHRAVRTDQKGVAPER